MVKKVESRNRDSRYRGQRSKEVVMIVREADKSY